MDHYIGWKPSFIKYTTNLNEAANNGNLDPVSGREKEIEQLINILSRRGKNNPLLVGEAGVGKTAVIEGFVQRIVTKNVPKNFHDMIILQLDISSLIAGAQHTGEFQERMKELIADLQSSNKIILFIDDIHLLLENNKANLNTASVIKQALDRNLLSLIGATTRTHYEKYFDKNKSLERDFQPVHIEEPSEDETFHMLQAQKQKFEKFHNVAIPDSVLKLAVTLTKRYVPQRLLPDKAIDVIDEAAAKIKVAYENKKRRNNRMRKDDIDAVISDWMGISISKLTQDESNKLLMLEKFIHKKFVDQNNAVTKVSEAVRRGRIGLGSSRRPVASFLFHGASGVGKTELVKVVTEILFEKDNALLQLDMSEYMQKSDVAKLIGAPPGYVGYEEGGVLTERVGKRPSTVILMDNIEKAHPDIANILLQILEEGYLTDNRGKQVSFKNTIIFCTTTIGNQLVEEKIIALGTGAQDKEIDEMLEKSQPEIVNTLLKFFSPEIINRFDGIVSFKPLNPKHMEDISRLLIIQTARLLKNQNFTLQITEKAVEQLAKAGFSSQEGARPLRRVIAEAIENPVAVAIISQKFMPGDTILVEYVQDKGFAISNGSKQILEYTKIKLPSITDIAAYETTFMNKQHTQMEANNIYELLKKLANIDTVTDQDEKNKLEDIKKQLLAEKEKGNPMADVILVAIQSLSQNKQAIPLPPVNNIQVVSEADYEAVKNIWLENYLNVEAIGNTFEAQIDWVKKETEATMNMIKLITSDIQQDQDQAMREIVNILPFLLIGGFTQDEIISYLNAKNEAAKSALEALSEEEESIVEVKKAQPKPEEKTMEAQNPLQT